VRTGLEGREAIGFCLGLHGEAKTFEKGINGGQQGHRYSPAPPLKEQEHR